LSTNANNNIRSIVYKRFWHWLGSKQKAVTKSVTCNVMPRQHILVVTSHLFTFHNMYFNKCPHVTVISLPELSLADPGGGRTRRAPPLTAADLWFFMPKTLFFLNFFHRSLRSRLILSMVGLYKHVLIFVKY